LHQNRLFENRKLSFTFLIKKQEGFCFGDLQRRFFTLFKSFLGLLKKGFILVVLNATKFISGRA